MRTPGKRSVTTKLSKVINMMMINQHAEPLDLSKYQDEYHTELLKLIEAKAKGQASDH